MDGILCNWKIVYPDGLSHPAGISYQKIRDSYVVWATFLTFYMLPEYCRGRCLHRPAGPLGGQNDGRQPARLARSCGSKPHWGFDRCATPQCEHPPLQSFHASGNQRLMLKAPKPGYWAAPPSSSSMRSSWLYLATRSLRLGAPVLIWQVFRATARSAMVVSSVSPER